MPVYAYITRRDRISAVVSPIPLSGRLHPASVAPPSPLVVANPPCLEHAPPALRPALLSERARRARLRQFVLREAFSPETMCCCLGNIVFR